MSRTQDNREVGVSCLLGNNVLLLSRFRGTEALGRPFEYDLELLSEDFQVDFDRVLGQPMVLRMQLHDDQNSEQTRYFHGFVSRFEQAPVAGATSRVAGYRATVVPWLWFLTRRSDCRIFQEKNVPQIVLEIFREHGVADFELRLTHDYKPREYCVQYRETDFDFVSRLLEDEGIYYYFEHTSEKHTLVLCDSISAHLPFDGFDSVGYNPTDNTAGIRKGRISTWTLRRQVQPGIYSHNDFDFKVPRKMLRTYRKNPRPHAAARYEIYDYPGGYIEDGHGEQRARVRQEELDAQHETIKGAGDCRGLACGYTFKFDDYPREDQNREYLITSACYDLRGDPFASASESPGRSGQAGKTAVAKADKGPDFAVSFTVIDADTPFRPARTTEQAVVEGPQTAVVTGPAGKEIHTDKHGRVKVQFHWDRYGEHDQDSSCWIRVSQPWAGKGWGGIQIPRIGQEVIVDFLEGDPDRPIITGRVYNGDNMPPLSGAGRPGSPPAPKSAEESSHFMTLKSNSLGGSGGHNEITMNDAGGAETLYIKAQKDETHEVGHDRKDTVGNDEVIEIKHDRTDTVDHDETRTVHNNRKRTVDKNETISIGKNRTENVGQNETVTIAMLRTHSIGINDMLSVGAAQEISIGAGQTVSVGLVQMISVGDSRISKIAASDSITAGKTFSVNAGDQIMLKTGDASITMKKDGTIAIKGKDISITASGKIVAKASGDVIIKGKKIAHN